MAAASYTYEISQGATLVAPFAIEVNGVAPNLTASRFKSTVKASLDLPDTDPTVIQIDWSPGSNPVGLDPSLNVPASGLTAWVVPAGTTQAMQPVVYQALIRAENVPGLPAVYDLMSVTLIVRQPVSSRF